MVSWLALLDPELNSAPNSHIFKGSPKKNIQVRAKILFLSLFSYYLSHIFILRPLMASSEVLSDAELSSAQNGHSFMGIA
jgi:hypothetical protein